VHSSPRSPRDRQRRWLQVAIAALVLAVAIVAVLTVQQLFGSAR
jgi:uncharacterized membrane protein